MNCTHRRAFFLFIALACCVSFPRRSVRASVTQPGCACSTCRTRSFEELNFCRICLSTLKSTEETAASAETMDHSSMTSMMGGLYGNYPMTRDASGTSWQPDTTSSKGIHLMEGDWMLMLHGYAQTIYDAQGGNRAADKTFSANMFMLMANRTLRGGKIGFRTMVSAEPLTVGAAGYPLLLQTGETANGRTPLIDRQHPHDLLMELATTYSHPISESTSVFVYFGLPGDPALGPPVYMHRFSGEEIPAAPITHHWLDSTHVTFGVATIGVVHGKFKFESSVFTGREPDQFRYDFDTPRFDSYSFRLSYNPSANWALQTSFGHLRSPEQLEPNVNQDRWTASAIYNRAWNGTDWQTTMAMGRDINKPGRALNGYLLESTLAFRTRHTVFARVERVTKDELFEESDPLAGLPFTVGEASLGYVYDFFERTHFETGLGGMATLSFVPAALEPSYGSTPVSEMVFLRMRLK